MGSCSGQPFQATEVELPTSFPPLKQPLTATDAAATSALRLAVAVPARRPPSPSNEIHILAIWKSKPWKSGLTRGCPNSNNNPPRKACTPYGGFRHQPLDHRPKKRMIMAEV